MLVPDFLLITTGQLLDELAAKYPHKTCIIYKNESITYQELKNHVDLLAKALLKWGIIKGEKVAICLPNCPQWIYFNFALHKIGAISVPLNTRFKSLEIENILAQSDSTTLVIADKFLNIDFIKMIKELDLRHIRKICTSPNKYPGIFRYEDLMNFAGEVTDVDLRQRLQSIQPSDIANIMYTSGTTGAPKGIILSHRNIVKKAYDRGVVYGINHNDRLLLPMPLSNVWGYVNGVLFTFTHGASIVLQEIFQPTDALKLLSDHKCTVFAGVPVMFIALMEALKGSHYDLRSLKKANISGALVPSGLLERVKKELAIGEVITSYGMSESSGTITNVYPEDSFEIRCDTVGRPLPDIEVKIYDPVKKIDLSRGVIGEICTKGYHVMGGYYKLPKETGEAIDSKYWLHTRDLGFLDEKGYLHFQGRIKDMYKTGGFNVYTQEVEDFLLKHPKIKEVAVVGIPDEKMGEAGLAFIQLKEGQSSSEEEIVGFFEGKIAKYNIPKYIWFVKEMPLSNTGKVMKQQMRSEALKQMGIEEHL